MHHSRTSTHRSGSSFIWVLALLTVAAVVHIIILAKNPPPVRDTTTGKTAKNQSGAGDSAKPVVIPTSHLPELPLPDVTKTVPDPGEQRQPILAQPRLTPKNKPQSEKPAGKQYPALDINDKRAEKLLYDAVQARQQDDIGTAIGKIREAERIIPDHPILLFELATTLEQMGRTDKAAEAYQKVHAMGAEVTGTYHSLSEQKLTQGMRSIASEAPLEEDVYIGNVEERRDPIIDPNDDSTVGLTLEITATIQSRPGVSVEDVSDIYIAVHLVDIVDGYKEELIACEPPKQEWLEHPVDWKNGGLETLRLTYELPRIPENADQGNNRRKYLGYVIELYYKGRLVDLVARPRRLARFTPAEAEPDVTPSASRNLPPEGYSDPSEW